jgi:DNA-binding NarL/FixJ family response regulator
MTPVVITQDRRALFRECLAGALRRELAGFDILIAADADGVVALARSTSELTHAVMEADGASWDLEEVAAQLHEIHPAVTVIGLTAAPRPPLRRGVVQLPKSVSPAKLAELIQPGLDRSEPFLLRASTGGDAGPLTAQQLRILALLSLGMTVPAVAARLGLSERGVTKSKVAIFSKLGVQSQAQAVARALATGLLGPAQAAGALASPTRLAPLP